MRGEWRKEGLDRRKGRGKETVKKKGWIDGWTDR